MVCETCIHDTHLSNEYGSSQLAALGTSGSDELSIEPTLSFHGPAAMLSVPSAPASAKSCAVSGNATEAVPPGSTGATRSNCLRSPIHLSHQPSAL